MNPNEFVINVVKAYESGIGVFQNKVNAEEMIPSYLDNLSKALYIFYVLQLDYAIRSQILYKGAKQLLEKQAKFYTPDYIATLSEPLLAEYLQMYMHPRYINEAIKRYKFNSQILVDKYEGDPRNIFLNVNSANEILNRLKQFRGFGPKIGNFFVRTMINTFEYSYPDIDTILPPVDIHDVRIAYLLGFTDSDQMASKNIDIVKRIWNKACKDTGKSWLIFDKALWLLGSEGRPKTKEDIFNLIK